jgi:hypothetical protein
MVSSIVIILDVGTENERDEWASERAHTRSHIEVPVGDYKTTTSVHLECLSKMCLWLLTGPGDNKI